MHRPSMEVDALTVFLSTSQIRICRKFEAGALEGDPWSCMGWTSATDTHLEHLEALTLAGIELFGPGSHWIEERHAALNQQVTGALGNIPLLARVSDETSLQLHALT